MSDQIDRQAAIDAIANCTNCGNEKTLREYVTKHSLENGWTGGVLDALNAVQDLPTAQPWWIPCSERLPKDFEDVLVWYEYFRYSEYNRIAQTWDVGYYISEFNRWGGGVTGQKVRAIAWMPLPEPYKEDEQG